MLIKAENISVTRNKKEILKNINIVINQKDFITILGPNGAGKSMLLKCLLGFYKPDNGLITKSPKKVIGLDGYGIKITKQEII